LSFKPALNKRASIEKMAYPLPDKPSIAVLPFVNMSEDKSQEIFSDGMTDDLITDLSKISGLFVIARNSTFVFKGKSVNIRQVAEDLGVRYVLEGSVRREGDQVRINAQLVDATTGRHLWAERYDENMRDIFSLQDKINQKIVAALAVRLTVGEKALVSQKGTQDPAAYEEFIKAREHHLLSTKEDYAKAEACFKRALELDPNYSRAKAALALLYLNGADLGMAEAFKISSSEARLRARQYLVAAMKNPTSIAYQVAGSMDLKLRQHDEAISLAEKALALDPNDPKIHATMSLVLTMSGRPAEGMVYAKSGMRLDPLNPAFYLTLMGLAHFCKGEWQEAATTIEEVLKLNPELRVWLALLVSAYVHLGRDEEAKAAAQTFRRGSPSPVSYLPPVQYMFYWPFKDRGVAVSFVESLVKAGLVDPGPEYIHVSREDQVTEEDLKAFYYPSKITGLVPGGSQQWSQEFAKDGTVTFRSPHAAGGVEIGRSWLEGDKVWVQYQKYTFGMAGCRTTFKNPRGTPERHDEYVLYGDLMPATFSRAQ
jgi:TolB-like protein/Flp pilus assembly protein TadD